MEKKYIFGIDAGGTVAYGLFDLDGRVRPQ